MCARLFYVGCSTLTAFLLLFGCQALIADGERENTPDATSTEIDKTINVFLRARTFIMSEDILDKQRDLWLRSSEVLPKLLGILNQKVEKELLNDDDVLAIPRILCYVGSVEGERAEFLPIAKRLLTREYGFDLAAYDEADREERSKDQLTNIKAAAIDVVGAIGSVADAADIQPMLREDDVTIAVSVLRALGRLGGQENRELLEEYVGDIEAGRRPAGLVRKAREALAMAEVSVIESAEEQQDQLLHIVQGKHAKYSKPPVGGSYPDLDLRRWALQKLGGASFKGCEYSLRQMLESGDVAQDAGLVLEVLLTIRKHGGELSEDEVSSLEKAKLIPR